MNHVENSLETKDFVVDATIGTDTRREVLLRTVNGAAFQKASRLKDFLLYVGTSALDGRSSEITEYHIAIRVFDRGDRFSPTEDNIVRATARMLRVKLKEHFEGEGKQEPWRIEIPKGTYIPVFVPAEEAPSPLPPSITVEKRSAQISFERIALILMTLLALWLSWRAFGPTTQRNLFDAITAQTMQLNVVGSDSLHARFQTLRGKLTPLEDYVSGQMFRETPPAGTVSPALEFWPFVRAQSVSDYGDLRAAMRLARHLPTDRQVPLRDPRQLRIIDFQEGLDYLLVGGQRANPWVGLFESSLTFQMVFPDGGGVADIRNLKPQPGEDSVYKTAWTGRRSGKSYARIAIIPGLFGKGRVILVAGSTGNATAAAADLLLNPNSLLEVEKRLGRKVDKSTQRLEVLLETAAVAGSTLEYRIVAVR